MSNKNEEVLTTTSGKGETSFMVCKTEENKRQKVCMDVEKDTSKSPNRATREKGMLDNNTYNLMEQLIVENKSLWRIKNNYKNDSVKDKENIGIWNTIEKDKEEIVKLLTEKLRERL